MTAFILSYRGSGRSQGSPTERVRSSAPLAVLGLLLLRISHAAACSVAPLPACRLTDCLPLLFPCSSALLQGLQLDAEAALDHVLRRSDIDPRRVVLFGRSLGGAVATYAACHLQPHISGLILENTFSRVVDLVPHMLPFLRLLVGPGRWAGPSGSGGAAAGFGGHQRRAVLAQCCAAPCSKSADTAPAIVYVLAACLPACSLRRAFNFLVRNRWDTQARMHQLTELPILFLSSQKVGGGGWRAGRPS